MNLEEQKRIEDKVAAVLESLTRGEKAIFSKPSTRRDSKSPIVMTLSVRSPRR